MTEDLLLFSCFYSPQCANKLDELQQVALCKHLIFILVNTLHRGTGVCEFIAWAITAEKIIRVLTFHK
jgi:hypothetical protein